MGDPDGPAEKRATLRTFDNLTRYASEDLARNMNRRAFLQRAGTGAFAFLITLATGKLFAPRPATAAGLTKPLAAHPACSPPGPYCNYEGLWPSEPDSCRGGHCFQHYGAGKVWQCHHDTSFYPTGCWSTAVQGGYWVCCDCVCDNGVTCGCAQFSGNPVPLPSKPIG